MVLFTDSYFSFIKGAELYLFAKTGNSKGTNNLGGGVLFLQGHL